MALWGEWLKSQNLSEEQVVVTGRNKKLKYK
jgi:hypothetical protein